jgi:hypothetical protein
VIDAAGAAPATPAPASDSGVDGDGVAGVGGDSSDVGLVGMTDGAVSNEPAGTVDGVPASGVDDGVPATLDEGVPAIGSDDSDVVDAAAVVLEGVPAIRLFEAGCEVDEVVEIDDCVAPAGRIQLGTTVVLVGDCSVD